MDTKEHLNSLYAKNGNLKQGQDIAKSSGEQMITQLLEQEERVKNILEFLKKKEGMCADMFKGMLLKNKSVKGPRNKTEEKTRKERSKEQGKNLKILLSLYLLIPHSLSSLI